MPKIIKWVIGIIGADILAVLFVVIVLLLSIVTIIMAPLIAILKFFGLLGGSTPDIPDEVEQQIEKAPGISALDLPLEMMSMYHMSASQTNVPWMVLAAMHKTATNCGREMPEEDEDEIGQFAFQETFWAGEKWKHEDSGKITESNFDLTDTTKIAEGKGWGKDIDQDKIANPADAEDAIVSVAFFLKSKGVKKGASDETIRQAIADFSDDPNFANQVIDYYHQLKADADLNE